MDIKDLIELEAVASEESRGAPIPDGVLPTRPGRPRVLNVRLGEAELAELADRARVEGLPVSTLARALILRGLGPEPAAAQDLRHVIDLAVHQAIAAMRQETA